MEPRELCLIFKFLTLSEIATTSQVCRKWCWYLWRETEQAELWMPIIRRHVVSDPVLAKEHTKKALFELNLKRQMKFFSFEDVQETYTELAKRVTQLNELEVKARWTGKDYQSMLKPRKITTSESEIRYSKFEELPDGDYNGASYLLLSSDQSHTHILACFQGRWASFGEQDAGFYGSGPAHFDGRTLIEGNLFQNHGILCQTGKWYHGQPHGLGRRYYEKTGKLYLEGMFERGYPHGEMRFYRENGTLAYQGNFYNGQKQGVGTDYHDDGKTIALRGEYNQNNIVHGEWFHPNGESFYCGEASGLKEVIEQHNATHKCTYELSLRSYLKQKWYRCETCWPGEMQCGVCIGCAMRCHKNHKLIATSSESSFFCDCGAGDSPIKCEALTQCEDGCDCSLPDITSLVEDEDEDEPNVVVARQANEQGELRDANEEEVQRIVLQFLQESIRNGTLNLRINGVDGADGPDGPDGHAEDPV